MNDTSHSIACSSVQHINRLRDLPDSYDAFVVDVWGVICDGVDNFPIAVDALRRMREIGPVALVSNTARRADALAQFLANLQIDENCYDVIVTAGDICHRALLRADWSDDPLRSNKIQYIGPTRDRAILTGTGLCDAEAGDEASAILCTGMNPELTDISAHSFLLSAAVECDLPFLCANPDKYVHIGNKLCPCAGALADFYKTLGGKVRHFGKPEPAIYAACLEHLRLLNKAIVPDRVLAIGDGLATDIAGANGIGMPSVLVRPETGGLPNQTPTHMDIRNRPIPDFEIQSLSW